MVVAKKNQRRAWKANLEILAIASSKGKPTAKSNQTVSLLIKASSNDPSLHGLLLKRSDDESKRASLIMAMVQPARTSLAKNTFFVPIPLPVIKFPIHLKCFQFLTSADGFAHELVAAELGKDPLALLKCEMFLNRKTVLINQNKLRSSQRVM